MENMVKYPIGIQSFAEIRKGGYAYGDKTELVYRLANSGKYYFLSRPRRFGKSLLLSTLNAYFEGRKELFEGLAINHFETEWKCSPVLMLSLARYNPELDGSLENLMDYYLSEWEISYGRRSATSDLSQRFHNVILSAYEKTGGGVVILIDEYDAPIVGHLHDEDKLAEKRSMLKSIYTNLKDCDDYVRFAMLTGVSRFSEMSVFSGLNNLNDISLDAEFAA